MVDYYCRNIFILSALRICLRCCDTFKLYVRRVNADILVNWSVGWSFMKQRGIICWQVSWVRRQDNGEKVNLLTVGQQTYIGDPRYTVKFQYPDNWRLQIEPVNSSDEGQYECQVSTHPPKYIHVNLHINGKYSDNSLLRSRPYRKS